MLKNLISFNRKKYVKKINCKAIILSLALSVNQAYSTGMPVIDISSITQQILGYTQQLKEIMMYEKQLEKMGVNLGQINEMLNALQSSWDEINSLKDKLNNLDNLDNIYKEAQQQCDEIKELNKEFAEYIDNNTSKLKNELKENAKNQACLEALSNSQFTETAYKNMVIEAQQQLIDGNTQKFHETIKKAEEFKKRAENEKLKRQLSSIQEVNRKYALYSTGNNSIKKELQKQVKEIENSMKSITAKDDSKKLELGLELQRTIISILLEQYEVMQNTSSMIATVLEVNSQKPKEKNEIKNVESKFYKNLDSKDFKKDPFGFPEMKGK